MHQDIAVIGMVCQVPGADNTDAFWQMLIEGKEGIRSLTANEMDAFPSSPQNNYIAAGGFIEGINLFDADFFSFTAREATLMDPQHRLWLQACWQALEITGQAGNSHHSIGVFASAGSNAYLNHILVNKPDSEQYQAILLGNAPDCLATRVSYSLNLTGPSMTIQCGCSSSLVALHQARLALLARQCDAALVGGVCLAIPSHQGYTYVKGGFASPDGHCRPFSNDAAGTVFSSGYGVVVIKRLADAIADGDKIYAVIKGSAINNDGGDKASFTAPSINGQAAVIAKALRVAGLTADNIQYIETHGTGTPIGDPIELAALEQAYKQSSHRFIQPYKIGSVKANIGHLDVAAGIMSFIKTCLMLHHQQITPQIHFNEWNSKCLNAQNLFKINTTLIPWTATDVRRAGVSAFGFGGTNAHVILEEATQANTLRSRHPQLYRMIVLSAKSSNRLLQWVKVLNDYLQTHTDIHIDELAYTLQIGRKQFPYRLLIIASSIDECVNKLNRITEQDIVICKISCDTIDIDKSTAHEVQQAWLSGHILNWKGAYSGLEVKKVTLPAAPLERQAYWFEAKQETEKKKDDINEIKTDVSKCLYQSVWREHIFSPSIDCEKLQPILIFCLGHDALITSLIRYFQDHHLDYYLVTHGDNYAKLNKNHFQINTQHLIDYQQLEHALFEQSILPNLCLLNVSINELNQESKFHQSVLFNLAKQNKLIRHIKQLTTLVIGMSRLQCPNNNPYLAMFTALSRGIGQEFPHIKTQLLDLDPNEPELNTKQVIDSMRAHDLTDLCVWRENKSWQYSYQLQPATAISTPYFKKEGIYLITGGLGNVASVHVEYLASEYQAKLILIGRTPIPPASQWSEVLRNASTDNKLSQIILRLKKWQKSGYTVYPYCADITNPNDMYTLCNNVINEWGRIDGIIHIAGAGSDMHYKILSETDWDHCWKLFAPKLIGVELLAQLAKEFSIAECLIISSISSALTGIGLSSYGATHNLLDAIVSKRFPHWRIMNWDAWSFYQEDKKQHVELGSEIDKLAIKPDQGIAILKYAFNLPNWHQLYVSFADLPKRHQYWAHRGFLEKSIRSSNIYPRPNLQNAYVSPITYTQQHLAEIWQSLLGLEKVGIHDSFFELGGHSLLALELINQLQINFQHACSIVDLFEAPTISQLSNKIESSDHTNQSVFSSVNDRVKKQFAARMIIQSIK